jgi:hypothetical protein
MLEHHQLEITESKSTINYISFVDADDYWYPTFLEEMFEKQIVFRHQSIFSTIEIKLQNISSTLCNSKNGRF